MAKHMITEMTGLDVAKLVGCEDVYLRNKQPSEEDMNAKQAFQESFKNIFNKIDRKPIEKDKNLV